MQYSLAVIFSCPLIDKQNSASGFIPGKRCFLYIFPSTRISVFCKAFLTSRCVTANPIFFNTKLRGIEPSNECFPGSGHCTYTLSFLSKVHDLGAAYLLRCLAILITASSQPPVYFLIIVMQTAKTSRFFSCQPDLALLLSSLKRSAQLLPCFRLSSFFQRQ